MKALSGESSSGGRELEQTKSLLVKRGSVGADYGKKMGEKERRQSMLPNLSKSVSQKANYLTVPNTSSGGGSGGAGGSGSGTGGMIKNAFNRLVSGNWSGWSGNIKSYKGEPMHIKVDQHKTKVDLGSLAICKEIAKIDPEKLAQREFEIKEFDYDTFQQTIEYIHNGQCKLSYETIPGLICAAEHYDLPDLLHACFHHANTHMKLSAAPKMLNALYEKSCFYITAMQLLDLIYDHIDPHGNEFFSKPDYHEMYESVFTALLTRKTLQINELKRFQAMDSWTREQILRKRRLKQQQKMMERNQQSSFHQLSASMEDQSFDLEKAHDSSQLQSNLEAEMEYKNLMTRLNKEVNIKLDKISNEDLVKVVLPTKVFNNDKIFDIMADESRMDY